MLRLYCTFLRRQIASLDVKCGGAIQSSATSSFRFYSTQFDADGWMNSLDEAQQKRVRLIQNEVMLHCIEEKMVPKVESLKQFDYEHLMNSSQTQRQKYYKFLFKKNNTKQADDLKSQIRKAVWNHKQEMSNQIKETEKTENAEGFKPVDHVEYGLGKGGLIPKIYNKTVDKWKNRRALHCVTMNYPKIIFDCGFTQEMNWRENHETAKQLQRIFGLNRSHISPFVLHFANMDMQSSLWLSLKRKIPTLMEKPLPLQVHSQDITEVFPIEKLVVLTPDSPNVLDKYDGSAHYVVSALVDRGDEVPLTLAKAKKLGIRTARLPMEQFRRCRINKTLTLDQVMQVMLGIKHTGDWNEAFRYVAQRKFH